MVKSAVPACTGKPFSATYPSGFAPFSPSGSSGQAVAARDRAQRAGGFRAGDRGGGGRSDGELRFQRRVAGGMDPQLNGERHGFRPLVQRSQLQGLGVGKISAGAGGGLPDPPFPPRGLQHVRGGQAGHGGLQLGRNQLESTGWVRGQQGRQREGVSPDQFAQPVRQSGDPLPVQFRLFDLVFGRRRDSHGGGAADERAAVPEPGPVGHQPDGASGRGGRCRGRTCRRGPCSIPIRSAGWRP